ncbi:MAG: homoserine dehydrogenase [Desulfobacterales bacterium]|nr:homoserine dehydrogenase [Desulfobacterales bacterium]
MKKIFLGLMGCGTVGSGVVKLFYENKDIISRKLDGELILKYIADIKTPQGISFGPTMFVSDAQKMIDDPEIDIVIETIGGQGIAKDYIEKAIDSGKHIVTANKSLIASHGNDLFQLAQKRGVDFRYEASVGGCIPIIKTLRESLVSNQILSMTGILNGTCNYILTRISDHGDTFEQALTQAQAKGYAEADPTLDIQGIDTAHKLAIINAIAYGMPINIEDIYVEGITKITPLDIQFAKQFGYRIKLIAISKNKRDHIEARVHPTMIPVQNILSNVDGTLNAINICGDAVGDIMLYGYGAGMMPTASAVFSDIMDIARNLLQGTGPCIPLLSFKSNAIHQLPVIPIDDIETKYYIRFAAVDRPGVLSQIAGVLAKHNISIESVHQKGRSVEGTVPIVMLIYKAREADVQRALSEISSIDVVRRESVRIRIEDD